jgi:CubicO group peptidase (beta-lactamase class C family)
MRISDPTKFSFSPDRLKRLDSVFQRYVDEGTFAGLVALVARKGALVYLDKFGYRDVESKKPMEFDTIFRIYSMTKPIAGVAFMMLFEQGLVRLEDPVSKYIPEFKQVKVLNQDGKLEEPKQEMTIHHLLTHTAGLDYAEVEHPDLKTTAVGKDIWDSTITLQESVKRVATRPLIYHPGEQWYYSLATDVLGAVIEVVSNQPIADYFEERIFKPLGMTDTAFMVPAEKDDRFATLYGHIDGNPLGLIDEETGGNYTNPTLHATGSGLVSTIEDYFKFASLVLNKGEYKGVRLLGPRTVNFMTQNHLPTRMIPITMEGVPPWYGMGFGLCFSVLLDNALNGSMSSNGSHGWGGWASTKFWVDPVEEIVGIMMLQSIPSYTYPVEKDFHTGVYQALME